MNDLAIEALDRGAGRDRPAIRKFNPGTLQSDEEMIEQFVVRGHELDIVLDVLRGNVDSPSCQHVLLVAPRGRGKTMLLARVAAALRTDRELSESLLPIRFMEESQEIFDLADFWSETLFYVAGESVRHDPELARELRATHEDLTARQRGDVLAERVRAVVLETAHRLGRKLVLMVENLQSLRDNVDADFGWKLREMLQSEPQIVLLGTATSRFKGLDDATQPFFELFRIVDLAPLTTEECGRLWRAVSGDAVSGRTIRPLEILTGGSPRLLVIVAEFARHRSFDWLMEELVRLIDNHTEYFRGHLEAFAKTERRVYLAVIDLWQPSSSGEVAARSRLDVRIVSTMLGRLVERGAVIVEGSGKRRRYAAAERLYTIYYKLRRERDEAAVVDNLVRFMTAFYSDAELAGLSGELMAEAARSPTVREGIRRALGEPPHGNGSFDQRWLALQLREGRGEQSSDPRKTGEVVEAARQLLKEIAQGEQNKSEAAIAACDEVLECLGSSESLPLRTEVAKFLYNKGVVQAWTGALEAAIATFDEVVERFGDSNAEEIRSTVARALVNRGAAEERTGEVRAAIATCNTIVERFGDSDAPELQAPIAFALVNMGAAQIRIGESGPAIAPCDEVVERFGDSDLPELRKQVATALVNRGRAHWLIGKTRVAIAKCDEVVERFGDSSAPELRVEIAEALYLKGVIQGQAGHSGPAILTCNSVVERFGGDDTPEIQAQVSMALVYRGVLQLQVGDVEAVISTCDEVVERFGASDATEMRKLVALALTSKGAMQGVLGVSKAAITSFDEAVKRFENSEAEELQTPAAFTMAVKAATQGMLGDTTAAIATCDELAGRFGDNDALELRALVATVSAIQKVMQGTLSTSEAVIAVCDDVIDLVEEHDKPELRALVAMALAVSRAMKGEISKSEAVIAVCGNLLEHLGASSTLERHALVAVILLAKGRAQGDLGEPEAAIATCYELVRRFGDSDAPEIQPLVAEALVRAGERQIEVGRALDALQTCEELDPRLDALTGRQKPALKWQTGWLRTRAHLVQGKHSAAMDTFRSVYAAFSPGDEGMTRHMLAGVPDLIAAGASERQLVEVLSSDEEKSGGLLPLVVALQQSIGEAVRAPIEVIEVAADIRECIKARVAASDTGHPGAAPE